MRLSPQLAFAHPHATRHEKAVAGGAGKLSDHRAFAPTLPADELESAADAADSANDPATDQKSDGCVVIIPTHDGINCPADSKQPQENEKCTTVVVTVHSFIRSRFVELDYNAAF